MSRSQTKKLQIAIEPSENIAVFASAGTGKTQLLVKRILKLLLIDTDPSHILAITFTRKAAAEMNDRLMSILKDWSSLDDANIESKLNEISHTCNQNSISKARFLYEKLLFSDHAIRITTFHSFCQDILKTFALHADVPAGFNVAENTEDLKQQARNMLYKLAYARENTKLYSELLFLIKHCGSVFNVNSVLDTFIDAKIDWWCFTENQKFPVDYALSCLEKSLISENSLCSAEEFKCLLTPLLTNYLYFLEKHANRTNSKIHETITSYLNKTPSHNLIEERNLIFIFLTKDHEIKALKVSKALEQALGTDVLNTFAELHERISNLIYEQLEKSKRKELLLFNKSWLYAGSKLLELYQNLKIQQRLVDFDDLEWHTYTLLRKHKNASWIQYKLDSQISHILIDEFQDTNPTQWNLLLPLLDELVSTNNDKSLFFVGDTKQSIYRFRRANPQLQTTASEWASENLDAKLVKTDLSYRSSPVIIEFVNKVFNHAVKKYQSANYTEHKAAHKNLWGQVQVDPLIEDKINSKRLHKFHNPLLPKKNEEIENPYYKEGENVAKRINELISGRNFILDNDQTRQIKYSDIIVLVRNRTHLTEFEHALTNNLVPFYSVNESNYLDNIEVQDIISLLTFFIQPYNNLALTQVLRSPLFDIRDELLMDIAAIDTETWSEKIKLFSVKNPSSIVSKAYKKICDWQEIANKVPVHDLLDKIYFDINIFERYKHSCKINKQQHVCSNLVKLLHLSLDVNAGRYSSIHSFLDAIRNPDIKETASKDLDSLNNDLNVVRILTIHAAKGLEAPVVFLIDTASTPSGKKAYKPLIHWPSNATRPEHFYIVNRKENFDKNTKLALSHLKEQEWLEELNLLYVALTRAKQYLFISGVKQRKNIGRNWFSTICDSLDKQVYKSDQASITYSYGEPEEINLTTDEKVKVITKSKIRLDKQFTCLAADDNQFIPLNDRNTEATLHGSLVHKLLELMVKKRTTRLNSLKIECEIQLSRNIHSNEFDLAIKEIETCLTNSEIKKLFTKANGKTILNELPVCTIQNNKVKNQIIDCLVLTEDTNWIIDFKTTPKVNKSNIEQISLLYEIQISGYLSAVKRLFPKRINRASIIFTSIAEIYNYDIDKLIVHDP